MRSWTIIGAAVAAVGVGAMLAWPARQGPPVRAVDELALREYTGVYQWGPDAFVYLQLWNEFAGTNQLVAFDETGDVRTLYPTDSDRFFTGPGAAVKTSIESTVQFQRDASGTITSLTSQRDGKPPQIARRVDSERHEGVRFSNGGLQLAGTLIRPVTGAKHPAIVLVHGSGPANREAVLPFARFLIRHGIAVLGYDKRGVGGSNGDWNTASFADLASDVVAAYEYLKTRHEIDSDWIGLLGLSQAGWVMPLAAVRAKGLAFLVSVSGAGLPAAETTLDHARHEMLAGGMRPQAVDEMLDLMKLQYAFAQTGQGWDEYLAARARMGARFGGAPPDAFPGTTEHPSWALMRRLYFYDPAPTLRQLQVPTLAIFGALDNNILADKNKDAWEAALKAGGHRDYTLRILPNANHLQLEATIGSNAEMASLQRFVPAYFTTVRDWLGKRLASRQEPSSRIQRIQNP